MKNDIASALDGILPPERIDIITNAYSLIRMFGVDAIDLDLNQIFGQQSIDGDDAALANRITDSLIYGCWSVLSQYGIVVRESDLPEVYVLLEALALMERDNTEEGIDIEAIGDDPVYGFCTIASRLTSTDIDQLAELVLEVDIKQLQAIYEDKPTILVPAHNSKGRMLNERRALLKQVFERAPKLPFGTYIVEDIISMGFDIDYSFKEAFELVMDQLDESSQLIQAWNLILLYIFTDAYKNLYPTLQEMVNDYYDDPRDVIATINLARSVAPTLLEA